MDVTDEDRATLGRVWKLLDIAQAAGRKMRLQDQADDLRLSHEVRMFASELANGNPNVGGAYWDAKLAIKRLAQTGS